MAEVGKLARVRGRIERHWIATEWLIGIAVAIAAWVVLGDGGASSRWGEMLQDNRAALYGTVAAVAGALLGFVLAAGSIMAPMLESPGMARVRESDQYPALWRLFLSATRGLGILTVVALIALVVDADGKEFGWLIVATLALATVSTLQVATCIWILENIVGLMTKRAREQATQPVPTPSGGRG
jgi:hypothetical protein